jgi:hypothetical protein
VAAPPLPPPLVVAPAFVVVLVVLPPPADEPPAPDIEVDVEELPPLPVAAVALVSELLAPLHATPTAATPSRVVPCRQENRWFMGPQTIR